MIIIRIKRKKLVMCMALASSIFTTTFASGLDYNGTIISPQAIIREDKFGDSKELDQLNIGSKVMIKEILDEWYLVELSNGQGEGWISSDDAIITDNNYKESKIKKGEVTGDGLRVRVGPSLNDNVITNVSSGHILSVIGESGAWYEVILSNNVRGWVHSDFVKITYNLPTGRLVNDSIPLKEYAGENEKDMDLLKISETVYIKGYQDRWYHVITANNKEGWVESKYVSVQNTNVNRSSSGRNSFEDIEAIATKYLGKKYVGGGNGPNSFDCSGFTSYILKTYYSEYLNAKGIKQLPRTATGQSGIGTVVNRGELQAGDLVFFDTSGKIGNDIGHVGFYIGNGRIIHASTSRRQIVIDSLSDRYYSARYMKAIRL